MPDYAGAIMEINPYAARQRMLEQFDGVQMQREALPDAETAGCPGCPYFWTCPVPHRGEEVVAPAEVEREDVVDQMGERVEFRPHDESDVGWTDRWIEEDVEEGDDGADEADEADPSDAGPDAGGGDAARSEASDTAGRGAAGGDTAGGDAARSDAAEHDAVGPDAVPGRGRSARPARRRWFRRR